MKPRIHDRQPIRNLADGNRSSTEIAALTGLNPKFVQKILLAENLPRLPAHSPHGKRNAMFAGGGCIHSDGYLIVSARWHPRARANGAIAAHRLVWELANGRVLESNQVIDHIDGLTLNNQTQNLRMFDRNSDHLRDTLTGKVPRWSKVGFGKMKLSHRQRKDLERIDTHHLHKQSGVVRDNQIALLRERFGVSALDLLQTVFRKELELDLDHLLTRPDHFYEAWISRTGHSLSRS